MLEDIALNQCKEKLYDKGYIDSYIGEKLTELGAVAPCIGVGVFDGTVTSFPLTAMLCVNAGIITNISAEFAVSRSVICESYDSFNKALSDLNSYNKSTGGGKGPEDIDQLWPTYNKIGEINIIIKFF